jgi:hypothetical protein
MTDKFVASSKENPRYPRFDCADNCGVDGVLRLT